MLMGLLVESRHNPASVLKDFFRSPGIVSLLVDSIRTPSGIYLESPRILGNTQLLHHKRDPGGLLQILHQEFTWTPDGVHQDPWLSVTTSTQDNNNKSSKQKGENVY